MCIINRGRGGVILFYWYLVQFLIRALLQVGEPAAQIFKRKDQKKIGT